MANIPNKKSPLDDESLNIDNLLINTVNRLGKSIQDLVAEGQLTPSQYANLIKEVNGLVKHGQVSIYDIDKNKGLLDQSFLSPELLKQIAGTAPILSTVADGVVTTSKVATNAITPSRTSFFSRGTNLFDGAYVNGWMGTTVANGITELSTRKNNSNYNGRTAVIPVKPNSTYTISLSSDADVWRVGTTKAYPDFTTEGHADKNILNQTLNILDVITSKTFYTDSNANFLLITPSHSGANPDLVVVEGDDASIVEEPKIPKKHLDLGSNIHPFTFEGGAILTSGEIVHRYEHTRAVIHERIKLSPGHIVGLHDYSVYEILVVRWDRNGNYLSSYPERTTHVKIKDGYEFVIAVLRRDGAVIRVSEFEEIGSLLFIEYAGGDASGGQPNVNSKYYLTDDIDHDFEMLFQPDYGGDDKHEGIQYSKVISDIDANIVNGNNDYVSKHSYGTAGSGEELYYYHYKPYIGDAKTGTTGTAATAPKIPKVVIITGVHGNEKSPVFGTYAFFNMVTKNYNQNKLFDFFRRNIEFIHIPVANPDGFNRNGRRTLNDVDMNADWDTDFWEHNDTGASRNDASGPFSQQETTALRDLLSSIDDITYVVDFHNLFFRDGYMAYTTSANEEVQKKSLRGIMKGARELQKKHSSIPQNLNHEFVYVTTTGKGTVTRWLDEQGIPTVTLETIRRNEWKPEPHYDYDSSTIEFSATILAELLKSEIKSWK